MNCSKCGQPLDPGASFCGSCGQPLVQAAPIQAQPIINNITQPVAPMPPVAPAPSITPQTPQPLDQSQQSAATMSQVIANQQPVTNNVGFGAPLMSAGGAIPSYATPATSIDHGGEKKAIIGLIFGVVGIPASLIPILGLAFGITGIVLATIAHKKYKHLMTTLAIIFSSISIVLALGLWVYGIQRTLSAQHNGSTPVSTLNSSSSSGSSSSGSTSSIDTPCYSTQIESGMQSTSPTGCDFSATSSTTAYVVASTTDNSITASNLQSVGQKSVEQAGSADGITVTSGYAGTFAGAPAYIANVTKTGSSSNDKGVMALVLKQTADGENLFTIGRFTNNSSQDITFGPIESNWTWK